MLKETDIGYFNCSFAYDIFTNILCPLFATETDSILGKLSFNNGEQTGIPWQRLICMLLSVCVFNNSHAFSSGHEADMSIQGKLHYTPHNNTSSI